MTITVKDAAGSNVDLKTTTDGTDEVPHHIVDSSALPTGAATESTLDDIKTAAEALAALIAGSELQVDVVASGLPSGAATASNQSTALGHLSNIVTAVQLIDNAIAGNEMQVDVVASLPAGTNNIGDVDVASVPAPLNVTGGGTETGALRVTIANNSTGVVSVDDNGGSLTVDGTVSVTGVATATKQDEIKAAIEEGTVSLSALVSGSVSNSDGDSTAVIAAQGSGVQTYLTDMTITNSSDTGVLVEIKDGSSTKWSAFVPAKGGITHRFASPLVGTANTAWNVDAASATTTLYAAFSGFTVTSA